MKLAGVTLSAGILLYTIAALMWVVNTHPASTTQSDKLDKRAEMTSKF